ncbi:MAG: tRNA (guanosine(37)-N1)-methyltransferase TrmD [Gammaproteobacteria bacterium]|nr:tRNA (guanosine(37)-N1)-methyltransferase TrmD [Gammaproteobacteria bacterium]MCH9744231.1 tRNA (guanosine(37)-N1)-methyltransferase TrmD [Gammaproteobacteria bacterium]
MTNNMKPQIDVISIFPDMFKALQQGITGRALQNKLLSLKLWNPRDFCDDAHRTVDDRPYGGGPGMVLKYEPLKKAIEAAKNSHPAKQRKVIYLSPQGNPVTQRAVEQFSQLDQVILLCGRYEGVDERLIETQIDEEWSIGDFVVSGAELPAMLLIDAIIRLIPGSLGDPQSAQQDSFSNGLLDCPHYTRPEQIDGLEVPAVLLEGNHKAIDCWRLQKSLGKTWQKRPDLIKRRILTEKEQQLLDEYMNEANHE